MAPSGWVVHPVPQRALEVREAGCATTKSHALAEVVSPSAAVLAGRQRARDADLESDTVANAQRRDVAAEGDHFARRLVTLRQGLADLDIAVGIVSEVVDVGATESGAPDDDLNLVCCWVCNWLRDLHNSAVVSRRCCMAGKEYEKGEMRTNLSSFGPYSI